MNAVSCELSKGESCIEGFNLNGASGVLWSKSGITSKIVLNSELPRERPKLAEG
jgi:hypothetical protein